MDNEVEYCENMIDILCRYAGEHIVFEAFVSHWGIDNLYEVISEIKTSFTIDNEEELTDGLSKERNDG